MKSVTPNVHSIAILYSLLISNSRPLLSQIAQHIPGCRKAIDTLQCLNWIANVRMIGMVRSLLAILVAQCMHGSGARAQTSFSPSTNDYSLETKRRLLGVIRAFDLASIWMAIERLWKQWMRWKRWKRWKRSHARHRPTERTAQWVLQKSPKENFFETVV